VLCRLQVLLHAPTPDVYSGNFISPWLLMHWDHIKTATVAAVVSYPLVLILALMQVSQIPPPILVSPQLLHRCRWPAAAAAAAACHVLLLLITPLMLWCCGGQVWSLGLRLLSYCHGIITGTAGGGGGGGRGRRTVQRARRKVQKAFGRPVSMKTVLGVPSPQRKHGKD